MKEHRSCWENTSGIGMHRSAFRIPGEDRRIFDNRAIDENVPLDHLNTLAGNCYDCLEEGPDPSCTGPGSQVSS